MAVTPDSADGRVATFTIVLQVGKDNSLYSAAFGHFGEKRNHAGHRR
jgi:hypothetical protein